MPVHTLRPPGTEFGPTVILENFAAAEPALWALAASAVASHQTEHPELIGLPGKTYTDTTAPRRLQVWRDAYGRIRVRALAAPSAPTPIDAGKTPPSSV